MGLQDNLTSGKRVVRPSDDPVAAAQAERALTRITRIQTEQRTLEVQRNAMAQAESSLGDAVNLVQEMRQLMVNAGSGTLTPNDRKTISQQLQSITRIQTEQRALEVQRNAISQAESSLGEAVNLVQEMRQLMEIGRASCRERV